MIKDKKKLIISAVAAGLVLAVVGAVTSYSLRYKETSFPQIFLNAENYTGVSRETAKISLENRIKETYKDGMKFAYEDKTYIIPLSQLGISIDAEASIDNVFLYGRRNSISENIEEWLSLAGGEIRFQNKTREEGLLVTEDGWREVSKIENPAQNFAYDFDGKEFIPVEAKDGLIVNQAKLKRDIEANLKQLRNDEVRLELIKDEPVILEDTDQKALKEAQILLEKEIVLKYDSNFWKISREDFGNWIGFQSRKTGKGNFSLAPAPDSAHIRDYLLSLVPQVNREPVNAQLEFKNGKVEVFSLSQDGIKLDTQASAEKIGKEIFGEASYALAENEKQENPAAASVSIELITSTVKPELTTESIDNMGITSLLATGESNFYGSTKSRRHNISVGSSKFNGILIGPGDQFSFNEILGNVGPKEGYLPELVIKQGKTVPEYGGGLCQVSTTAFRGAVAAGLEVTERKNHAYAVKYYAPQGTDATIYPPHPDLAFINNTPNYILIQTRTAGDNLYFDFYGTNDGRQVKTEGPIVYERGAGGAMKTWWKQQVFDKDENLILEKIFYSNYKSPDLYPRTNPLE